MLPTMLELFAGCGGVSAGLRGLVTPRAALEYDGAIAEVYTANHPSTRMYVADVATHDPLSYETTFDWMHASPSCKRASRANVNGGETAEDLASADAVCRHIRILKPSWFSLENVRGYLTFVSFTRIIETLKECGYDVGYWILNSADYGVPQTRERLWLLASRENRVRKPTPTHSRVPRRLTWDTMTAPWRGWFGALAERNLLDTLPESAFAPWQLDRLEKLPDLASCLVGSGNTQRTQVDSKPRLLGSCGTAHPANAAAGRWRAFIVEGTSAASDTNTFNLPVRYDDEPIFTVKARPNPLRALLVSGSNTDGITVRDHYEAAYTMTASVYQVPSRALIVDGQNAGRANRDRTASEPVMTLPSNGKASYRAWLETGRVVALTPQAGAALQGFPAEFILPDRNSLAWTVVGNAAPPEWMPHIYDALGVGAGRV